MHSGVRALWVHIYFCSTRHPEEKAALQVCGPQRPQGSRNGGMKTSVTDSTFAGELALRLWLGLGLGLALGLGVGLGFGLG